MREIADLYKALADETRLMMMALLLRHGELCVCDVEAVLQISQSKASRHLRYLKNVGLVTDRREGAWVYYGPASSRENKAGRVLRANGELILSTVGDDIECRLKTMQKERALSGRTC